ncbi:hypothetical protein H6G76_13470 [Nostoc sp. FACHB-152]|uniref:hypothetical protein n=1 Tax=unclassified Nostoc TaxID=2593658 RepID=UPI001682895E|nr:MULTISPECIES: hypothetical protein [unclassified Nostoc]MBD2448157.1 hypothetical protein [Nostoc sp. FACHB-152]MBD2470566.1 hypothetical protein [Nostoc sp. FACHB-145]
MASIKISELRPAGSELFQDSESFLNELSENREMDQVMGGFTNINVNASIGVTRDNDNNTIGNTIANSIANSAGNSFGNQFTRRNRR